MCEKQIKFLSIPRSKSKAAVIITKQEPKIKMAIQLIGHPKKIFDSPVHQKRLNSTPTQGSTRTP
jgi:hypothetical protein